MLVVQYFHNVSVHSPVYPPFLIHAYFNNNDNKVLRLQIFEFCLIMITTSIVPRLWKGLGTRLDYYSEFFYGFGVK